MTNIVELWRPVVGYEGLYEVSNLGRVKSLRSEKLMKLSVANSGYMQLSLSGKPSRKVRHVHRLVLEAFIGPCPPNMEGCHANGIRTDNRLENLRWDTRKGNMADAIAHGRTNRGERNPWTKFNEKDIRKIRESIQSNSELAKIYGVTREAIRDIKSGRRWGHIQ
jgi:hypothetical protein